ncbi:hypothetical protein [Tumebacillus flagellatus]|nr:hypothetical protein [Tumebacillus flagellatus]
MKNNVFKAIVGGIMGAALVAGLFVSVASQATYKADLVWPENIAVLR